MYIFFSWVDPPISERSRSVISGLLRRVNKLEEEKVACERKKKKIMGITLLISWIAILALFML